MVLWWLLLWACAGPSGPKDSGDSQTSVGPTDSEDTSETGAETGETSQTGETGETGETSETGGAGGAPAGEATLQLDCEVAEPEGLAVRVWWPAEADARHPAGAPILVRVGGAGFLGWDLGHDPGYATSNGAAVVQFLRPGTSDPDGSSSGGLDDLGGTSVRESVTCILDFVLRDGTALDGSSIDDLFPHRGHVVTTGLSLGGTHVLNVLRADPDLAVPAAVLWESPLTGQLTLQEVSPVTGVDPLFSPGTCTLDNGCPFPGRASLLRWDAASAMPYQDTNGTDTLDPDELYYRPLVDAATGVSYFSNELHREISMNAADVFGGPQPAGWPSAADTAETWRTWGATETLIDIRDNGSDRAFIVLASGNDHSQILHEHTRVGMEGVSGASFFRLNGDAAYVEGLGVSSSSEFDAMVVVSDHNTLAALPDPRPDAQVLAAELELADRVEHGVWDVDLAEPLQAVTSLVE